MADLSDVENALVGLIAQAVYPNGNGQPSAVSAPCKVYRGWPLPKALETDMRAGTINVNVWPTDVARNTTRYDRDWKVLSIAAPTLTVTVSGATVTVGGTVAAGQNAAVVVDGRGYSYPVQAGDTLAGIATALAALISADRPATSAGAVVTIANAKELQALIGTLGTSVREVSRELRQFFICLWCPTPDSRDAVSKVVAPALAAINRIDMPDGTQAILQAVNLGKPDDYQQKDGLYRRTLVFSVEYGTTQTRTDPTVVITSTVTTPGTRIDTTRTP